MSNSRFMAFKVTDKCVSCGGCATQCSVGAIGPGEKHYEINQELGRGCGCCSEICPQSAIVEI